MKLCLVRLYGVVGGSGCAFRGLCVVGRNMKATLRLPVVFAYGKTRQARHWYKTD